MRRGRGSSYRDQGLSAGRAGWENVSVNISGEPGRKETHFPMKTVALAGWISCAMANSSLSLSSMGEAGAEQHGGEDIPAEAEPAEPATSLLAAAGADAVDRGDEEPAEVGDELASRLPSGVSSAVMPLSTSRGARKNSSAAERSMRSRTSSCSSAAALAAARSWENAVCSSSESHGVSKVTLGRTGSQQAGGTGRVPIWKAISSDMDGSERLVCNRERC